MNIWPLPAIKLDSLSAVSETRPVALITTSDAWANVRRRLTLPLLIQAEPTQNSAELFNALAEHLPSAVEVIYAVGDHPTPLNAAKFVASQAKKPLVVVPTALSDLEILTAEATVGGQSVSTGPATTVILDLEWIGQAPPTSRAAAIADIIGIITALRDWGYAAQHNKLTPATKFNAWAASVAANAAQQGVKIAPALGRGDPDALRALIDLMCITAQIDNLLGHRRATRGAEYQFAEAVALQPGAATIPHAERLAAGILVASALLKLDVAPMRAALEGAGLRVTSIRADAARATLNALPDYVFRQAAPYGVLNDLKPNSDEIAMAIANSTLA